MSPPTKIPLSFTQFMYTSSLLVVTIHLSSLHVSSTILSSCLISVPKSLPLKHSNFPSILMYSVCSSQQTVLFTHTTFLLMQPDFIVCEAESEFLCNTNR